MRGLTELGLSQKNLTTLRDLLNKPRGIVLATGPAGAGKTTTLYAALAHLAETDKNILTLEDQIESPIPSVKHTQFRASAGISFSAAIRALLRQNPDVLMISEIGDPETAQLALRAAVSNMLVLTTLETNRAADAIPHLMEMGLEPYLLASGIVGVIAQRVMKGACDVCKVPTEYPLDTLEQLGLIPDPDVAFYRGVGCDACSGTGYRGQTAAFEIMVVDATISALIRERADAGQIHQAAVSAGMNSLAGDALSKVFFGESTIEEVLRVAHA